MMDHLDRINSCGPGDPPTHQSPVATSTPYVPPVEIGGRRSTTTYLSPGTQEAQHSSFLQAHSTELTNTTRVIAAPLHHAKLEPPVFAGDGEVHEEEWLQAVSTYMTTLNLTDTQILNELPHFLPKDPSKWFNALNQFMDTLLPTFQDSFSAH
ncbi:hypothetical protein AMECASPLE_034259 [Ameca splendens]|uniref:Uncharacterized protein n=1 Tax=Ameca splendens TaxID=208324 RepID=A0ABV0Z6S4_9TELE